MEKKIDAKTPEFKSFIEGCQSLINDNFAERFPLLTVPVLRHNNGRRYFRIELVDEAQTFAHCFVDRTNGDVLKAAGWKGPAKHARGNIFDDNNGLGSMSAYGPAYLI